MRFFTSAVAAVGLGLLAACVPPAPPPPAVPGPQPGDVIGGTEGPGPEEREPDLCGLSDYLLYQGQPGSTVDGLSFARPFRVVEFGAIVTQEYDPARVNFFLDPSGTIVRVACG